MREPGETKALARRPCSRGARETNEWTTRGTRSRSQGHGTRERKSERPSSTVELGELDPQDPREGRRPSDTEPLEGKMARALDLGNMSTRRQRIGQKAKVSPELVFTSLAHNIDLYWIWEALKRTRKDGAVGVDNVDWKTYASNWRENLRDLLERFKSGSYKAPPAKRAYIPKADGSRRPIAITTLEDKVLQRGVSMVLETVYEQDFYDFSFGYRPGKSAHLAVKAVTEALRETNGGWVLEVDVKGFFDAISHRRMREILDLRVCDGVIRRAIDKWLKAGILEKGVVTRPKSGTPQGGVASPLLANIYLHEVLDKWFVEVVKPRLKGSARLFRFADDCVPRAQCAARAAYVRAAQKMRVGPSKPPYRRRLQTTLSCQGKEPW